MCTIRTGITISFLDHSVHGHSAITISSYEQLSSAGAYNAVRGRLRCFWPYRIRLHQLG